MADWYSASREHDMAIVYAARNRLLFELGFSSYLEYLESDLWLGIRTRVLSERPDCVKCKNRAVFIHHASYDEATLLGKNLTHLHPVCKPCHSIAELRPNGSKRTLYEANTNLGIKTGVRREQRRTCSRCPNAIGQYADGTLCKSCKSKWEKMKRARKKGAR